MLRIKRILSAAAAATLLLTALAVPALAHGGHHGGGRRAAARPANVYCSYCEEYHTAGTHCGDCDYLTDGNCDYLADGYCGGHHGGGHGRCRS